MWKFFRFLGFWKYTVTLWFSDYTCRDDTIIYWIPPWSTRKIEIFTLKGKSTELPF